MKNLLKGHSEWLVIDEAADGIEAIEKANLVKPDVVILDVSMPRMDGLQACRLIRKDLPQSEILIVTQHDSPQMMREAMDSGARGYVVKSNMVRDLLVALKAVSQHTTFPLQKLGSRKMAWEPARNRRQDETVGMS